MILDQFKDARAVAFSGLGVWMLGAQLGQAKRIAHVRLNLHRKAQIVLLRGPDPMQSLLTRYAAQQISHSEEYTN